jgi:hypothetical protein
MAQLVTYSAKNVNFSLQHPLAAGPIQAAGVSAKGVNSYSIRMGVEHANLQVAADGAIVPSWTPGEWGDIEISLYQTSTLHQELLAVYDAIKSAADAGDASEAFAGTIVLYNSVDGSTHTATGAGFQKVPDKAYGVQAAVINWILRCCDITSE